MRKRINMREYKQFLLDRGLKNPADETLCLRDSSIGGNFWVGRLLCFAVVCLIFTALFTSNVSAQEQPDSSAIKKQQMKADTAKTQKLEDFIIRQNRWEEIEPPPYELNVRGRPIDPYNQNKLKGDYPIIGQNTFLVLTATVDNIVEGARLPTPSGVSADEPRSLDFFEEGERLAVIGLAKLSLEFYHGDVAFRPRDWEFKVTAAFNLNFADLRENNAVNINPLKGTNRTDSHFGFQELSVEKHLFNVSDRFDFISLKAGIQKFNSDFRGFIFNDFNLGARLFGSFNANRFQYNFAFFDMLEKDTNSELNIFAPFRYKKRGEEKFALFKYDRRDQQVGIFNLYKQDLFTLGYTGQLSFHYLRDKASSHFDENGFPVRPAVIGNVKPHDIKAYYLGWTGDGHFGRLNINHAFYQVLGKDDFNSVAGRPLKKINAQMAALELSVDQDWKRYRLSAFYSSGDSDPSDDTGKGFDTILDFPFFAGGPFSFWNTQGIKLQGVNLVNRFSLVPDLRSSKPEGQPNFVNPGIIILNAALDAEITPKLKTIFNFNYLRFVNTAPLTPFLNQPAIRKQIGLDYGFGIIYRPFLNNNAIFTLSTTAFTPLNGFADIFESRQQLFSVFTSLIFTY